MANQIDKNVYALSISLALESDAAFATLDTFNKNISDVEKNLANAAKSSLQTIQTVGVEANTAVSNLAKTYQEIDSYTVKIQKTLIDSSKELTDQFNNGMDRLKDAKKEYKQLQDEFKLHEDTGEELEDHITANEKFCKGLENIVQLINLKNQGHKEQNKLLGIDNDHINSMDGGIQRVGKNSKQVTDSFREIERAAKNLWSLIKEADEATEQFTTSNYRLYGSQQNLAQGARDLTMEHGVFSKEAQEAYKVLGNLKTPREEIGKYAESIAKANRYMGVSIDSLGTFSRKMRVAGGDATSTERQLKWMSGAMRGMGLNAQDVSKILGDTTVSGARMKSLFSNKDAVEGIDKIKASLMGVNTSLGQSTDVANSYINTLMDNGEMRQQLTALTGREIETTDDLAVAITLAKDALKAHGLQMEDVEGITRSMNATQQQSFAEAFTGGNKEALTMLMNIDKLSGGMSTQVKTADDLANALGHLKPAVEPFDESMNTMTAQLNSLQNIFKDATRTALQPFVQGFADIFKILNEEVIPVFRTIGVYIQKMIDEFKAASPMFERNYPLIKRIGGVIGALGISLLMVVGSIGAFSMAFSKASGVVKGAGQIVDSIAKMVVSLATALGESIKVILSGIGQGLGAILNAVKGKEATLLKLAFALIMIAAAAYIFAMAIEKIGKVGDKAPGIMAALTLSIIALLVAIVLAANAIKDPVTMAAMILIAVVFIAIGLGAMMAGYGLKLAAEAVMILNGSLEWSTIAKLFVLGIVFITLGALGYLAAPGIAFLSLAIVGFAFALMLAIQPMERFAAAMSKLIKDVLITLSSAIVKIINAVVNGIRVVKDVIGAVADAIVQIINAIVGGIKQITEVAGPFLSAAIDMAAAGAIMIGAAVLLLIAAALLVPGGYLLALASGYILEGGTNLAAGVPLLVAGASKLQEGVNILREVSGLARSTALLLPGAKGLAVLGSNIAIGGMALAAGGAAMHAGAEFINNSVALLSSAGISLPPAIDQLKTAGGLLSPAALDLLISTQMLLIAGMSLIMASVGIHIGMRMLALSVDKFASTVDNVQKVAVAMALLAGAFATLQNTPMTALRDMSDKTLGAMPGLEELGDRLTAAATKLDVGVTNLEGPANRLIDVLDRLGESMSSFGGNLNLGDDIGELAGNLEKYATLLETTVQRIETAVKSKAVPAMKAAEEAGIAEAIKSEAISTVQVMYDEEGNGNETANRTIEIYTKQVSLLESLDNRLAAMQGDKSNLTDILALLQTYLPQMNKTDSGLGSEFNSWAK